MSQAPNSRAGSEPQVSAAMLKRHRADWHLFTRAIVYNCVGLAVVLLLMLLFLRVL